MIGEHLVVADHFSITEGDDADVLPSVLLEDGQDGLLRLGVVHI